MDTQQRKQHNSSYYACTIDFAATLSVLSLSTVIINMSGVPPPGAAPANMTVQQMQQMQQMMAQQQQQQQQQQMAAAAAANQAAPQAPTSSAPPPAAAAAPVPSAPASQPPQDLGNLPIRAYLDQTVVPILLDGKEFVENREAIMFSVLCLLAAYSHRTSSFLFATARNVGIGQGATRQPH